MKVRIDGQWISDHVTPCSGAWARVAVLSITCFVVAGGGGGGGSVIVVVVVVVVVVVHGCCCCCCGGGAYLTLCGLALRSIRMTRPRVQRTSP